MPNSSSPHGARIVEGAISSGTLRTYDLMRTFADELRALLPFNGARLAIEADAACAYYLEHGEWEDEIGACYILEELEDNLGEIAARDGFYFGTAEGDGACFGFWKIEDEEE